LGEPAFQDGSHIERSTAPDSTGSIGRTGDHPQWRTFWIAAGGYTVLAVLLWWHIWTSHPTSTTTCGCGDSSFITWSLDWPAYAISHGQNPLFSTALFHPTGFNLLSNAGVAGIGIALAPVTWLFGPVATFNVALTLAPILSALAMFALLRRWVTWTPAAFIGGLLYGFSPFILISLTDGHLMAGMAPIPPLVVLCLDEMLVRQRWRPAVPGIALGVLLTIQFFFGTEMFVMTVIVAGIGVILLVLYGLIHWDIFKNRLHYGLTSVVIGGVTSVILLAYPVWFTVLGPGHFSGPIWGAHSLTSYGGTSLHDYFFSSPPSTLATSLGHRFGGYQAPTYSGQYFGFGIVAVLVIGTLAWWRDRRLWLFGALTLITVELSFGLQFGHWTLWRLFVRFPEMVSLIPSRFLDLTYLAVAVMIAVIIDHVAQSVARRRIADPAPSTTPAVATHVAQKPTQTNRIWGTVAGLAVAGIALAPIAIYYAPALPFTTRPVAVPLWYRTVAPQLPKNQVLLSFPVPFALMQSTMTWQAIDNMHYSMAGGSGPGSILQRAGQERAGQLTLANLSLAGTTNVTSSEIPGVRKALDGWGVTMVVVPDPSSLPIYEQVRNLRAIVTVMTAAIGRAPVHHADAWVWSAVNHSGPPVATTTLHLNECGGGPVNNSVAAASQAAHCVLSGSATGQ